MVQLVAKAEARSTARQKTTARAELLNQRVGDVDQSGGKKKKRKRVGAEETLGVRSFKRTISANTILVLLLLFLSVVLFLHNINYILDARIKGTKIERVEQIKYFRIKVCNTGNGEKEVMNRVRGIISMYPSLNKSFRQNSWHRAQNRKKLRNMITSETEVSRAPLRP